MAPVPQAALAAVLGSLCVTAALAQSQSPGREEMYRRYLQFPELVVGGSVEPLWDEDGSSFRFVESDKPIPAGMGNRYRGVRAAVAGEDLARPIVRADVLL